MADEEKNENLDEVVAPVASDGGGASKPRSNLLPIIIVGFAVVVVTPLITFFVVKSTVPPPLVVEEPKVEEPTEQTVKSLGTLFVNIAETKGTRVLKVEPYLVLSEPRLDDLLGTMEPMLRDKVLIAASTKTIDELEGLQGRENLKKEIITLINDSIKGRMKGAVVDVYFNEFLIQ
jgi:flagellar basal body-associated protein FliL